LVDGSIHNVSPDFLSSIVVDPPSNGHFQFPTWLGQSQKVMFLHNGEYLKGIMVWDLDNLSWRFSQRHWNGQEIFGIPLPDFHSSHQQLIEDGTIIPGWRQGQNFRLAGSTRQVSAVELKCLIPPGSLGKALYSRNPDRGI
jgi:hypothetical protein